MAIPYCTGPAYVYVQPPGYGAPVFFGTTERTPRIEVRPAWSPLFNDIGGNSIPFDMMYQGCEALTSGTFTRWNEVIHAAMATRPNSAFGVRGLNVAGDIGSFMIAEGMAYPLWVQFPYAAKALFTANGMPPGYKFPFSWLEGPDDHEELGTNPYKIGLLWHSMRGFNKETGEFSLYSNVLGVLPPIN